ncbi:MAG TPA: phospholipase D-like domain-containing protein [Pseudolabrys sp.]|uniref:phospholipase D-like domain-containing protein n=1 Tax=Pseudolabrys sp. TaxID=1960880 RepID=UPI002DDD1C4B|nr:phospholipase D-like domain-containing protein [Pseudolabrys sp.]HEV2628568.1 phospholipase D-like domain-containing protein [Pseudolabrys sp.]
MTIEVKAFANADDILIAWEPATWSNDWVGFQLERRDETSRQVTVIANRIPPKPGGGPVQATGISSTQSPIRRCIWTDHSVVDSNNVSYRVTAMKNAAGGGFAPDAASASDWTAPTVATGEAGGGLTCYFNRGTLMSQIVSRFVNGDVSDASLRQFLVDLEKPGFNARRYLSGDILPNILKFLRDADRRGSAIHLAIYEINDHELVDALKPFGKRGHVLLGNGGATKPWVAQELTAAGVEVRHRDLSHGHGTSPSVHNKFLVESDAAGKNATRVLTGSTNWTTTGLCTQLNNVLIVENAVLASRFLDQWGKLVAAGDAMPPGLVATNSVPKTDGDLALYFAASKDEAEFKPVLDLIAGAKHGILFLMFAPGNSPLLKALLDRVLKNDIYVRGVVSRVVPPKNPTDGDVTKVGGEVVKSGAPAQDFYDDVTLPSGVSAEDHPSWEETEFNVAEMLNNHLMAIVHSKVIVVDPFSDNCAVITGSHNFSDSASHKNDENLVIVRGNTRLGQAYAVHINGVYDHYSWRAYLGSGGDPNQIYKPLDGWKPGGARYQELAFWMNAPIPPRKPSGKSAAQKKTGAAAKKPAAKKTSKKTSKKKVAKKTVRKTAGKKTKTSSRKKRP